MAYRTRYYPPLSIETNQLPTNVVTEDKIAAGAVGGDEIQDGAVSGADLAPNSITADKIVDGSVGNAEIAAGAVTADKLATPPVTRPLSPLVATAEIANGAITVDKMAAATIGTDQIVNEAVTTAKYAPDSIDNSKIKTNAVDTANIVDGSIDEDKLGTDSVITAKIKDDNVTTEKIIDEAIVADKLSPRAIADYFRTSHVFYDEFEGAVLSPAWAASGDAPGTAVTANNSSLLITTGPLVNDTFRINFNAIKSYIMLSTPRFYTTFSIDNVATVKVEFGFIVSATEYIRFSLDTAVDGNWHIVTRDGGATTDTDTGIAAVTDRINFQIDYISATEVKFYIAGALVGTHTTNVPGLTDNAEPQLEIETLVAATRELDVERVIIDTL